MCERGCSRGSVEERVCGASFIVVSFFSNLKYGEAAIGWAGLEVRPGSSGPPAPGARHLPPPPLPTPHASSPLVDRTLHKSNSATWFWCAMVPCPSTWLVCNDKSSLRTIVLFNWDNRLWGIQYPVLTPCSEMVFKFEYFQLNILRQLPTFVFNNSDCIFGRYPITKLIKTSNTYTPGILKYIPTSPTSHILTRKGPTRCLEVLLGVDWGQPSSLYGSLIYWRASENIPKSRSWPIATAWLNTHLVLILICNLLCHWSGPSLFFHFNNKDKYENEYIFIQNEGSPILSDGLSKHSRA